MEGVSRVHGVHQGQPILETGEPLGKAQVALVLVHGRGGTAEGMLPLAAELALPGFAYLAPQAAGNTWYPYPFLAPISNNEPELSSALAALDNVIARLDQAGISPKHTMLLGFSQGACLVLEYMARRARRYAGVVGLSGGLIGPEGTPRDYPGSLAGTPVFLGCSDPDFHIPTEQVLHTAEILRRLDGQVTVRLYPNMGHMVNQDEIDAVKDMMLSIATV